MYKTELYPLHKRLGAKMIEFSEWEMPVEYTGIRDEHIAVRKVAGLFDISHMGEIEILGKDASSFCQWLTTNDINRLKNNQAHYTLLCNFEGGIIDDVILYKFSEEHYFMCVNAVNTSKDYEWINNAKGNYSVNVLNSSLNYSLLSLQGPDSENILNSVIGISFSELRRFYFVNSVWHDVNIIFARTGYTGEDGFEIFIPWGEAGILWNAIMENKNNKVVKPCGLGARDTLRIEMGYSLYDHEINEYMNPIEAGLSRYVKIDKGDFIGKGALLRVLREGTERRLFGFEMLEPGIARQGYQIFKNGENIGTVTSGTLSPTLDKSIGIALLKAKVENGDVLDIDIRGRKRRAKIVSTPFIRN